MIMRGQDIYSCQDEATTSPSSSESEEAKGEESSEEIYPQEEGDLLMVRRRLGGQSCDLTQSHREYFSHKV